MIPAREKLQWFEPAFQAPHRNAVPSPRHGGENRETDMRMQGILLAVGLIAAPLHALAGDTAPAADSAEATGAGEPLRIGIDAEYEPFIWQKPDGELAGFEYELAEAFCATFDTPCEFIPHPFSTIIPALNAGKFDAIIASMYAKDERREKVDFSKTYYFVPGRFVAPKSMDVEISRDGLEDLIIGVQRATLEDRHVTKEYGDVARIRRYESQEQVYLDAASGRIDVMFAMQVVIQRAFLDTPDGAGWEFVGPPVDDPEIYGDGAAVAVRKGDADLRRKFNNAIDTVLADGTYRKIQDKWFDFNIYGRPYGKQASLTE
jgi:ABC-type amino acid transport substrate-binding protein